MLAGHHVVLDEQLLRRCVECPPCVIPTTQEKGLEHFLGLSPTPTAIYTDSTLGGYAQYISVVPGLTHSTVLPSWFLHLHCPIGIVVSFYGRAHVGSASSLFWAKMIQSASYRPTKVFAVPMSDWVYDSQGISPRWRHHTSDCSLAQRWLQGLPLLPSLGVLLRSIKMIAPDVNLFRADGIHMTNMVQRILVGYLVACVPTGSLIFCIGWNSHSHPNKRRANFTERNSLSDRRRNVWRL